MSLLGWQTENQPCVLSYDYHIEVDWHIYASVNLGIIGSDNGLLPFWCQAVSFADASLLLIGPLETYFGAIWIKIQQFSLKKMNFILKCHLQIGGHFASSLMYYHMIVLKFDMYKSV